MSCPWTFKVSRYLLTISTINDSPLWNTLFSFSISSNTWLKCMDRLEWFNFCISYRSKDNWWVHNNAQLSIYSYKRCRVFYSILLTYYFSITLNLVQTTLIIHTFWTKIKFRMMSYNCRACHYLDLELVLHVSVPDLYKSGQVIESYKKKW